MRVAEYVVLFLIVITALVGLGWYGKVMLEPVMNQPYVEDTNPDDDYHPTFDDPQRSSNDTEGSKKPVGTPPAAPDAGEPEGPVAEPLPVPVESPEGLEAVEDGKPLVPLPLPVPLPETVEAVNLP